MRELVAVTVKDASNVAEARRRAVRLATSIGFNEATAGKLALIITEMGTNLVKHVPQGGELLAQLLASDGVPGLEILALDQGPGIPNVTEALRDGYSTAGSPGTGLGALGRLSSYFDVYSGPGKGTAILAHLWNEPGSDDRPASRLTIGAVHTSKPGQPVSGDAWAAQQWPDGGIIFLADGLGHGPQAAEAAQQAVEIFRATGTQEPEEILSAIHDALDHTRGAAVAAARLDVDRGELRYAGLGNIAGVIYSPARSQHLVSYNGTAGHSARKIEAFRYAWPPGGLLILHSDGLKSRWNLDDYPGLTGRHPALVAGVLYRDHKRGSDDAVIVVARETI